MSRLRWTFKSQQTPNQATGPLQNLTPQQHKELADANYLEGMGDIDWVEQTKSREIERLWGIENVSVPLAQNRHAMPC
jgi:hypothetical protein